MIASFRLFWTRRILPASNTRGAGCVVYRRLKKPRWSLEPQEGSIHLVERGFPIHSPCSTFRPDSEIYYIQTFGLLFWLLVCGSHKAMLPCSKRTCLFLHDHPGRWAHLVGLPLSLVFPQTL